MFSLSKMNEVTWYSRLLALLFIFGIFPTIVFFIGKRYQETMTVLVKAEKAQHAVINNNVYFSNPAIGQAAIIENNNILGEWISNQDGKYVMKVNDTNVFYEVYDGRLISSGSWILRSDLPGDYIGARSNGTFLQKITFDKNGKEKSDFYKVEFLDGSRMTLNLFESGGALSFSKASSTKGLELID